MAYFEANPGDATEARQSDGTRRALCIGIDNYPNPRDRLGACVADARSWQSWFADQGFQADLLLDAQATRDGITNAIRDVVHSSSAGDVIAIQYSGHGTQLPDRDGDEQEGSDEALVPYDHRDSGYLVDDDLAAIAEQIPNGVNVTFLMDCCHSGTITRHIMGLGVRAEEQVRVRFLAPDIQMLEAHERTRSVAKRGERSSYQDRSDVLFSACQDRQTAKERRGQGDFTRYALQVLNRGIGGMTNKEFIDQVNAIGQFQDQNPEIWTAESRHQQPLLGAEESVSTSSSSSASPPSATSSGDRSELLRLVALIKSILARVQRVRSMSSSRATGRKRALCIGINDYVRGRLNGCVKDARDWDRALSRLGFDTQLLLNHHATARNMLNAMRQIVRSSRSGDVIVIQYSGHGSSLSGGSDEGTDEALVPVDFHLGRYIIDDDIGKICDAAPAGVNVTFFMDCCHSGTNTRLLQSAERSTDDVARFMPADPQSLALHLRLRESLGQSRNNIYRNRPEILFAACKSTEKALEPQGGGNGYFTGHALRVIERGIQGVSNEEFIDRVRASFGSLVSRQRPQLFSDDEFYGRQILAPRAGATPGTGSGGGNPASEDGLDALLAQMQDSAGSLEDELDQLLADMTNSVNSASGDAGGSNDPLDELLAEMQDAVRRFSGG